MLEEIESKPPTITYPVHVVRENNQDRIVTGDEYAEIAKLLRLYAVRGSLPDRFAGIIRHPKARRAEGWIIHSKEQAAELLGDYRARLLGIL